MNFQLCSLKVRNLRDPLFQFCNRTKKRSRLHQPTIYKKVKFRELLMQFSTFTDLSGIILKLNIK